MHLRSLRPRVVLPLLCLALVACSADEPAGTDTGGTVADARHSAEVQFMGETYQMTADGSFGCFLSGDGGSQGGISFDGEDDQGNRLVLDWAGDSPDATVVDLELADGTEWTFDGTQLDVTLTPPSAVVSAPLLSIADGSQDNLVARPSCP